MDNIVYEMHNLLEIMPFACAVIDENLKISYINPEMSELLDLPLPLQHKNILLEDFITGVEKSEFRNFLKSSPKDTKNNSWKILNFSTQCGVQKQLFVNKINPLDALQKPNQAVIIGIPVSEFLPGQNQRKAFAEDNQQTSAASKYISIFNNANFGIIIFDEGGVLEELNQAALDHLGIHRQAVIERHFSDLFEQPLNEKVENLFQLLEKSKHNLVKDVLTLEKNQTHIILELSLSKICDQKQNYQRTMMITENITDQKDTHAALIQSEKLALTGRLAASLAHEINNPLQTSIGCLGLAEEMLDEDDKNKDLGVYLSMAMDELKRSSRIVKKLRDLNKKSDLSEKTKVDLQEIIEGVLILTKNRLDDRDIAPVLVYQGKPPVVLAAKDQIQQVILNIVMNAIDAMPEGGSIYFDIVITNKPKGVRLKIRDTGCGIDQEMMANLFDPFFSTKDDGLGLGLFICNKIIEDHEGTLEVSSDPGRGTVFTIWLPCLD